MKYTVFFCLPKELTLYYLIMVCIISLLSEGKPFKLGRGNEQWMQSKNHIPCFNLRHKEKPLPSAFNVKKDWKGNNYCKVYFSY